MIGHRNGTGQKLLLFIPKLRELIHLPEAIDLQ